MAMGSPWSEAKPTLNTSDDGTKSVFPPLTLEDPGREFALPVKTRSQNCVSVFILTTPAPGPQPTFLLRGHFWIPNGGGRYRMVKSEAQWGTERSSNVYVPSASAGSGWPAAAPGWQCTENGSGADGTGEGRLRLPGPVRAMPEALVSDHQSTMLWLQMT